MELVKLLYDNDCIMLNKKIALLIGVNEGIVLQELYHLSKNKDRVNVKELYNGLEFYANEDINMFLKSLVDEGIVNIEKVGNSTFCAISYAKINNVKNSTKDKKKILSFAPYVKMTEEEYNKLVGKYSEGMVVKMIEVLDNYKGALGKKYKSDYRAILNWVAEKVLKEYNHVTNPNKANNYKYLGD